MRFIECHCETSCVTDYLYYHLDIVLEQGLKKETVAGGKKRAKTIDSLMAKKNWFLNLATYAILTKTYERRKQDFAIARTKKVQELANFGAFGNTMKYDMVHRTVAAADAELKNEGGLEREVNAEVKENNDDHGKGGDERNGNNVHGREGNGDTDGRRSDGEDGNGNGNTDDPRSDGQEGDGGDGNPGEDGKGGDGNPGEGGDGNCGKGGGGEDGGPFKTPRKNARKNKTSRKAQMPKMFKTPSPQRTTENQSSPRRSLRNQL